MQTIFKFSKHFGRRLSRQQEALLVMLVPLTVVILYALWGATLLN